MQIDKAVLVFCTVSILISCNTLKSPFSKHSPHEKYADAITNAGLKETVLGKAWFDAAEKALSYPQQITLPYKETGFFASDKPFAAGFIFNMIRGENVVITLSCNPDSVEMFLELWHPGTQKPSLLASMDTISKILKYTVTKNDSAIVRIQPELLADVEYTITITTGPSLAFPVDKSGHPHMISFWGNERDNGSRKHEGVDIAAKFRTPALAASDGIISRVNENNLGGKVVFLRDANTGNNLYYAHLDSQIAVEGEKVKIGDTIGLIGKTGDARNTVPHLHFGIYTFGGAIDPFPFINPEIKEPKKITASLQPLNHFLRTTSSASLINPAHQTVTVSKDESVFILAATDNDYKVRLLNGETGYLNSKLLTDKEVRSISVKENEKLLLHPSFNSPVEDSIPASKKIEVLAVYNNFYLVNYNGIKGWIQKS